MFFGRTFISDTPMVFFSVAGMWGLVAYAQTAIDARPGWASPASTLACMVKIPAVLMFAPIAWLAWMDATTGAGLDRAVARDAEPDLDRGDRACRSPAPRSGTGTGTCIFHRTGLGQAIFHPSGGYSPDVAMAMGPIMGVSHWSTLNQLRDPEFYSTLLDRTYYLHLTPAGFALALVGLAIGWTRPGGARRSLVWLAAVCSSSWRPPRATGTTSSISCRCCRRRRCSSGSRPRRRSTARGSATLTGSRLVPLAAAACVLLVGLLGFDYSNVVVTTSSGPIGWTCG